MSAKVCVIGAGRWGKNHVRTLARLGALGGVVEPNSDNRKTIKDLVPEAVFFSSIDEALQEDFAGFTVATPAETHFEIGRKIITAGKHILIEKPLALHSKEARELSEMADKHNVNLMVGHVMLFHPAVRKIHEHMQEGSIGKLEYVYSNRLNLGTVRKEENILWSFAPHDISIFQYLIGLDPVEIHSSGGRFLQPHIHDTTMTTLSYPNNIVAHAFVSWLHPFKEHRLVVIGSKGMFSFDDSSEDKDLYYYEKGIDWVNGEPIMRDGPTEIVPYERSMPLTNELQYFVDHLDGTPIDTADGHSGAQVLDILEQASDSLDESDRRVHLASTSGKVISLAANKEFFVHESSYVDNNVHIGKGSKVWHFSHIQTGAQIGENCSIGQNVNVANNVRIGNGVKIQNNVSVYEGVELEDYVFCGPSMVFTNVNDPRSKYPQRGESHYSKTLVREGASIGANATIVCGHTIGSHAFIAAGAVVTQNIPDFALIKGIPGKISGWMCECGETLSKDSAISKETTLSCSRCQQEYTSNGSTISQTTPSSRNVSLR